MLCYYFILFNPSNDQHTLQHRKCKDSFQILPVIVTYPWPDLSHRCTQGDRGSNRTHPGNKKKLVNTNPIKLKPIWHLFHWKSTKISWTLTLDYQPICIYMACLYFSCLTISNPRTVMGSPSTFKRFAIFEWRNSIKDEEDEEWGNPWSSG